MRERVRMLQVSDYVTPVLIGLAAGFIGALVGIGGSSISSPTLIVMGYDPRVVAPAALFSTFGTSLGGIRRLLKSNLIDFRLLLLIESASSLGAIAGALTALRLPKQAIQAILGFTLLFSSVALRSYSIPTDLSEGPKGGVSMYRIVCAWLAAVVVGFVAGTTGIGGGALKVLIMIFALKVPLRRAVATAKLMVGFTAAAAFTTYAVSTSINLPLAILLTVGTYTGATISSKLLVSIDSRKLKNISSAIYAFLGVLTLAKALLS